MIGYGPEDNHFVVELTYNYGIGAYQLGNDFQVRFLSVSSLLNDNSIFLFIIRMHIQELSVDHGLSR